MAPTIKSSKGKAAPIGPVGSKKPTKPKQAFGQYSEDFLPVLQSYSILSF
jgi:hypothetical protein